MTNKKLNLYLDKTLDIFANFEVEAKTPGEARAMARIFESIAKMATQWSQYCLRQAERWENRQFENRRR